MNTRPPEVSDDDIVGALASGWGVAPSSVEYAPVGFGSHHWRAADSRGAHFVSVDDLEAGFVAADSLVDGNRDLAPQGHNSRVHHTLVDSFRIV